ncbi:MAG: beta-lactamase family protein [Lewinella sp.]|nr:beta-lactamase family protein [Lewinella sp.]
MQSCIRDFTISLKEDMQNQRLPGVAVAIVYEGQPVMVTGFGQTDLDHPFLVNDKTVFRIASLSKGFAAVLVGVLVDEGILSWDDPVIKYLPDFKLQDPDATRHLTIRHLLSHTTGLPRHAYSNLLNQSVPYRDIIPMLKNVPLAHAPGSSYNYQNVAYSLIADVVEHATGLSYDSLLVDRLFRPLDMQTASVGYQNMVKMSHAAYPHSPDSNGYHRLEFQDKWYDVSPAAGVNASAEDMAKWLQLMMGHHPEVLSAASLQEITRSQIEVSPRENVMRSWRPLESCGYAMGWRTAEKWEKKFVFHGGFVNGYRAEIGFCPEEKLGIAVLSNGANSIMKDILPNFFDRYLREKVTEKK